MYIYCIYWCLMRHFGFLKTFFQTKIQQTIPSKVPHSNVPFFFCPGRICLCSPVPTFVRRFAPSPVQPLHRRFWAQHRPFQCRINGHGEGNEVEAVPWWRPAQDQYKVGWMCWTKWLEITFGNFFKCMIKWLFYTILKCFTRKLKHILGIGYSNLCNSPGIEFSNTISSQKHLLYQQISSNFIINLSLLPLFWRDWLP